jgi:hypothetical protein
MDHFMLNSIPEGRRPTVEQVGVYVRKAIVEAGLAVGTVLLQ